MKREQSTFGIQEEMYQRRVQEYIDNGHRTYEELSKEI